MVIIRDQDASTGTQSVDEVLKGSAFLLVHSNTSGDAEAAVAACWDKLLSATLNACPSPSPSATGTFSKAAGRVGSGAAWTA